MSNSIMLIHDVLSKEDCDGIINQIPEVEEYYKQHYANTDLILKTQVNEATRQDRLYDGLFTLKLLELKGNGTLVNKIGFILSEALNVYADRYPIIKETFMAQNVDFGQIKLQKTEKGMGFHSWHFEDLAERTRFLVWTIFLNDVEEGGETEFLYQGVRIPARQGCLCVFPSDFTHTHRGNPPISNEKWILTGWYTYNFDKQSSNWKAV